MEKGDYNDGTKGFESEPFLVKSGNTSVANSNIASVEPVGNRRVMTKIKPNRFCVSLQQRVRSSLRYVAIVVLVFVLGYFAVHYMQIDHQGIMPMLDKDRSASYNVKVLPLEMSDKELNELSKESFSYLAMIDAGSSGCRAHVYRYGKLGSITGPLYVLPQHQSRKVKPGLSSFADKPMDAGVSLADLVHFLKEQVPETDWDVTPIWLKATAGLRMLPSEKSEAILDSVRAFLSDKKNSPFLFRASWAKVIPGNEEGGFGWIAFNYLKKIIGPKRDTSKPMNPYAVIEMGGASAQVSQMAPSIADANLIPPEYRFSFTIEGDEFHLYTHSYLGYGAEQAREQFNRYLAKQQQQQEKQTNSNNEAAASTSSSSSSSLPSATTGVSGDPCKNEGVSPSQRHYHYRQLGEPGSTTSPGSTTAEPTTSTSTASSTASMPTTTTTTSSSSTSSSSTASSSSSVLGQCVANLAALFSSSAFLSSSSPTSSSSSASDSPSCSLTLPQSFNCVHQPPFVAASTNILAFENFFYMSSALGVPSASSSLSHHHHMYNNNEMAASNSNNNNNNSLTTMSTTTVFPLETTPHLIRRTSDHFCHLPWVQVSHSYPKDAQPKEVNEKMCFLSAFSYAFLVDGLKLSRDKTITIQKEVDGSEIEWALGAAYKEAAGFLKRTNLRPT